MNVVKNIGICLLCFVVALPALSATKKTVRLAICQILVIDSDRDTDMQVIALPVGRSAVP